MIYNLGQCSLKWEFSKLLSFFGYHPPPSSARSPSLPSPTMAGILTREGDSRVSRVSQPPV